MTQLVARVQTKPTRAQWLSAVIEAWIEVFGTRPYNAQMGVLYGMFGEETGYGESCWNFNVGNIRAMGSGYDGLVIDLPGAWEDVKQPDGSVKRVVTGGAFRAYLSLVEGYKGLLSFLRDHEPHAIAELMKPAPSGVTFVYGLKTDRYFTGDVISYARAVASIASTFERTFSAELAAPIAQPKGDTLPNMKAVVAPIIDADSTAEDAAAQACLEVTKD
jgi:hypothetical protein